MLLRTSIALYRINMVNSVMTCKSPQCPISCPFCPFSLVSSDVGMIWLECIATKLNTHIVPQLLLSLLAVGDCSCRWIWWSLRLLHLRGIYTYSSMEPLDLHDLNLESLKLGKYRTDFRKWLQESLGPVWFVGWRRDGGVISTGWYRIDAPVWFL